jgi:hypothetical protein
MRRSLIVVGLLLFLLALSLPVFAADPGGCGCRFEVNTPSHTQVLGGNSGDNSHKGLHQASDHSQAVVHVMGG